MSIGQPIGAVLKRISDMALAPKPRPGERCELCAALVADEHGHVVDLQTRALMCTCRPCYLVFAPRGSGGSRYRAVPDRFLSLPSFQLEPGQWEDLQIPVGVAFFFMNSALDRVAAFYPSPAGATESLLSLDTWAQIVEANPELATMDPDVEAFLVRHVDAQRVAAHSDGELYNGITESFLVPIDVCYELVGELRRLWRGFDGGAEAHGALEAFFDRVRARARPRVAATVGRSS